MRHNSLRTQTLQGSLWFPMACVLTVFATLNSNMIWLGGAFLLYACGSYKTLAKHPQKFIAVVACVVLAMAAVGYQLGKDAAIRDRSVDAAHVV